MQRPMVAGRLERHHGSAGEDQGLRREELLAGRADAHGIHESDTRQQRMLRTIHHEPLHAPHHGRRLRGAEQAYGQNAHGVKHVERAHPQSSVNEGSIATCADTARSEGSLQNRVGDETKMHHRHGSRQSAVVAVLVQIIHGGPDIWQSDQHAFLRVEKRIKNWYVLFTKTSKSYGNKNFRILV